MKRSIALMACGALALTALGGCETQSPPTASANAAPSQCLDVRKIQRIISQDSQTVDVVTYGNNAFELKLNAPCLDLNVQTRPEIRTRGTDLICGVGDGSVFYPARISRIFVV